MTSQEAVEWLLARGGPSIRYRAATELLEDLAGVHRDRLAADLLSSPLVREWLERLVPDTRFNGLHGAKHTTFENAMGKLIQLGCRAGMSPFDARTQPFRAWLEREMEEPEHALYGIFPRTLVSAFLLMAGYAQDPAARTILARRLNTLYRFARQGNYDIYVNPADYPGIPSGFKGRPLVNPDLYRGGDMQLPWVYDLYALAHFPKDGKDSAAQRQIDAIVEYILHPDYQRLEPGYGIAQFAKRRYYAIGWNIDLPGYFGFDRLGRGTKSLVRRAELMAHFPAARTHRWFRECLEHLETFRTERGTYRFPRQYLSEDRMGYWVGGNYMGLEANRRTRLALELESTFWMLKIRKLASAS